MQVSGGALTPQLRGRGCWGRLSWALPLLSLLSLPVGQRCQLPLPSCPQDAELEGSRLVLQLKHPSHATPAPCRHPEPCGKVGAPPGGLL